MGDITRRDACKAGIAVGLLPNVTLAEAPSSGDCRTGILVEAYKSWQSAYGSLLPGSYVTASDARYPTWAKRDIVKQQYALGEVVDFNGYRISLYEFATLSMLGKAELLRSANV